MRVERNVAGIQGLHIVYDAFPERVEQLMFDEMKGFRTTELAEWKPPYPAIPDMKNASMKTGSKPYAAGGIAKLAALLTNGAAGGREQAAGALGNLARNDTNRVALAEAPRTPEGAPSVSGASLWEGVPGEVLWLVQAQVKLLLTKYIKTLLHRPEQYLTDHSELAGQALSLIHI